MSEDCWEQRKFLSSKYSSFVYLKLLVLNIDFDETIKKAIYRFTATDLLMLDLGLLKENNLLKCKYMQEHTIFWFPVVCVR